MKVEGAPRCLKAFWNPEVSWILPSPKGLSRTALNSESVTSGVPWAPALILQGVHRPLPPALCPQVGFICPMSALKQPPASTLLSEHLCLQQCLVGLGGLFWSCKVHREGHTTEHRGFDIHPPPLTAVFLPSVLAPVYSLSLPSPCPPPPFSIWEQKRFFTQCMVSAFSEILTLKNLNVCGICLHQGMKFFSNQSIFLPMAINLLPAANIYIYIRFVNYT